MRRAKTLCKSSGVPIVVANITPVVGFGVYAMIAAYLDESGDSAEVCVIAGYFGGTGQWRKFEVAWRKVLLRFAVPLDKFHAKDLMNRCGCFHT